MFMMVKFISPHFRESLFFFELHNFLESLSDPNQHRQDSSLSKTLGKDEAAISGLIPYLPVDDYR